MNFCKLDISVGGVKRSISMSCWSLCSRFAAKLVSSGGLVLVCVVQKDSSAQLTVNTERTVVGSMLLRELQTTLGAP